MPWMVRKLLNGLWQAPIVAQHLHARLDDEGRQPDRRQVGIYQPVIGWIGRGEVGEALVVPVELAAVHDGAADAGAVPADELGGGVRDDIRAPLERAEQVRRGEGVVDHQRDLVPFGDFSHFLERKHGDIRVAQRFAVDDLGVRADGALEVLRVGRVDEGDIDAEAREGVVELVVGAAVQPAAADDVVARPRTA